MTTAQIVHMWFAGLCFGTAVLGLMAMVAGFLTPPRSKIGSIMFTAGLVSAVGAVVVYLIYIVAMVVAVAVTRS